MQRKKRLFISVLVLAIIGLVFQNCRPIDSKMGNTITGNPFNTFMKFSGYEESDSEFASKTVVLESATGNINIKLCLNYVNLKYFPPGVIVQGNPDVRTGMAFEKLIELQPSGTNLGFFSFENGEYNRIEVNVGISRKCEEFPYGITMQVTNSHGTFNGYRGFQLEFDGQYIITDNGQSFELPIQKFVEVMAEVDTQDSNCGQSLCKSPERLIEYYDLGWVSWAETDL